jgi:hypothetical protein
MTVKTRTRNNVALTTEFVYYDRATGRPHFGPGSVRKYTAQEAAAIERNFADTGTGLREITPFDRVMLALGRAALEDADIHRVTFKGRRGYHEHLNGLEGFVAVQRGGGGPQCFRADGSKMCVVIIEGELKYSVIESLWPRERKAPDGEEVKPRKPRASKKAVKFNTKHKAAKGRRATKGGEEITRQPDASSALKRNAEAGRGLKR